MVLVAGMNHDSVFAKILKYFSEVFVTFVEHLEYWKVKDCGNAFFKMRRKGSKISQSCFNESSQSTQYTKTFHPIQELRFTSAINQSFSPSNVSNRIQTSNFQTKKYFQVSRYAEENTDKLPAD